MSEKSCSRGVTANITRRRAYVEKSVCDVKKVSGKSIGKSSEAPLKKLFLPNDSLLQLDNFDKDNCLLLPYRLHANNQKSVNRKQRLGIRLDRKYKIINTNLRKRLYSEDPPPPDDIGTVTDIDDGFFRYLNGHSPLQFFPQYKLLKCIYHKHLRMKQEVGYRQDCVLNIEVTYKKELATYKRSINKYMEQVKQFDVFVSEDYRKSMECLKNSEKISIKLEEKKIELEYLANRQFIVQSKLIGLDFKYCKQQKYGRFLYYLSPPIWRAKHRDFARSVEIEAKGFDLGTSSEEDTFNVIFEKMQNDLSSGLVKPVLYFCHPDSLMDLFESMEKQLLHHFTYVNLVPHIKVLKQNITKFKTGFEQDCSLVVQTISGFENYLVSYVESKNELEVVFMKILHGLFYDSVAGLDFLNLDMHLEFCYEKIYAEKPLNVTILYTAKALEHMYMAYSLKLEEISNNDIKRAMKQSIEDEKLKMKKAFKAARELRLFDRLKRALLRAYGKGVADEGNYDTPLPVNKQSSRRKSEAYVPTTVFAKGNSRELTDAEVEYLAIFTDWTEVEDPADYLQSL